MKRWRGKAEWLLFAAIIVIAVIIWLLVRHTNIDVLSPQGVIAAQQKTLLIVALLMSAIVIIPVFFMLGFFAYKYRADKEPEDYDPEWKENSKLEIVWWGIPMDIIGVLAVITWFTSHSLDPYKSIASKHPAVNVQVVALQWKWLFLYPDDGLATVNYVMMPKDVPVRFRLTADAPMSAFWIPSLGSQIYNMNGMSSELNLMATKNGTYKGYSTNINGEGYSDMKFDAKVVSHDAFHDWITRKQQNLSLPAMNEAAFIQLRKPSQNNPQATYHLQDNSLYQTILAHYMGASTSVSTGQTGTMNTMNMTYGGHN